MGPRAIPRRCSPPVVTRRNLVGSVGRGTPPLFNLKHVRTKTGCTLVTCEQRSLLSCHSSTSRRAPGCYRARGPHPTRVLPSHPAGSTGEWPRQQAPSATNTASLALFYKCRRRLPCSSLAAEGVCRESGVTGWLASRGGVGGAAFKAVRCVVWRTPSDTLRFAVGIYKQRGLCCGNTPFRWQ
jgi:hypothetical protein